MLLLHPISFQTEIKSRNIVTEKFEFINEFRHSENNKWNEINILININENEINKEIYFLNKDIYNINELNEINKELYLNE